MVSDGTYTAVLDRVEETQSGAEVAVLLLESDDAVVDDVTIERDRLPEEGRQPDAVLDVTIVDGDVQGFEHRPEGSDARSEAAQSRFDRLSDRPPESDEES